MTSASPFEGPERSVPAPADLAQPARTGPQWCIETPGPGRVAERLLPRRSWDPAAQRVSRANPRRARGAMGMASARTRLPGARSAFRARRRRVEMLDRCSSRPATAIWPLRRHVGMLLRRARWPRRGPSSRRRAARGVRRGRGVTIHVWPRPRLVFRGPRCTHARPRSGIRASPAALAGGDPVEHAKKHRECNIRRVARTLCPIGRVCRRVSARSRAIGLAASTERGATHQRGR